MILTTGIVVLSRKVADERAKRREAKQGLLKVGESDVARQAFARESNDSEDGTQRPLARSGTTIRFERPADIMSERPNSNEVDTPTELEAREEKICQVQDAQKLEGDEGNMSRSVDELEGMAIESPKSPDQGHPTPYSPALLSPASPSASSQVPSRSESDDSGNATVTNGPDGIRAIRIRTKGSDLKSGFPYHSKLFDLRVRPEQWQRFTAQVVLSTKFSLGDNAKMVSAAAVVALTGAVLTSFLVGRTVNHNLQEKKVRTGLGDMSKGGLGDVLQRWNETEFHELGLFAHLKLSESAMKRQERKSTSIRKPSILYPTREERERKQAERKFCLVVTKLDDTGLPIDVMNELSEENARVFEAPNPEDALHETAELPGDQGYHAVELPAEEFGLPSGYAELESSAIELPGETVEELKPAPLMVRASMYADMHEKTMYT